LITTRTVAALMRRIAVISAQPNKEGTTMSYKPSQVRKTVVATIGILIILANSALTEFAAYLPNGASVAVTAVVGFVTAVSVFLTKNAPLIDSADNF
jgi:hypothetical protein